ncbi:putative pumilio homolog 7, chloroplastic [Euphorbia lathyris]|uniref:putative pumilio homolog 7, chloroplastic n=1 Tax=Euphorbia lathyris TaxID=212925 RepID=UPI003313AA54
MGKLTDGDKWMNGNVIRNGDYFNDQRNVPYFGLLIPQSIGIGSVIQSSECSSGSSSSSNSFSNGFLSHEDSTVKNDREREIFNDVPNAPYFIPQSMVSNGFSSNELGSQFMAPISEESSKYQLGLCFDSKSPLDEFGGLSQRFSGINIGEEVLNGGGTKMKGSFDVDSSFGFGFNDHNVQYNAKKHSSFWDFNNGGSGFQSSSSPNGVSYTNYDDLNRTITGLKRDSYNTSSMGSSLAHNLNLPNNLCSGSAWYTNNQTDYLLEQRKEKMGSWINWDNHNPSLAGSYLVDPSPILSQPMNQKLHDGSARILRNRGILNNGFSHPVRSMKCAEDSFIIQGGKASANQHLYNKRSESLFNEMSVRGKSIKLDNSSHDGSNWVNVNVNVQKPVVPSVNSLSEVQGNIYLMAQDQNGCRWLQRIFDEGTKDDIQIIFNEIIEHIVELMLKPFGNYVIQKFLDVCDEKQRLQIVLMVTDQPGQLVRICLNTYGTRAVQKLIETLKTRHQISFVVTALKPGFLDLVKDQNGNHVIQRCLQCLSNEDNKFIFDAAAKFCVDIATHRHGCCVMQRCITHSTGKSRDKLVTEISKNSLLLAQDPFGNYVVQYIVELKSPSAVVNLLTQFKRHYVHLSMQKFSSHVVEKCLNHLEDSREQIVRELISVSRFEQLVQDPFANYVIQSALAVTKGPLHSMLVDAVRPHMILRTNPYSKRIFSRNLLKK